MSSYRTVLCPICQTPSLSASILLGGYQLWCCPSCTLRFASDARDAVVDYDAVYDSSVYDAEQVSPLLKTVDPQALANIGTYIPFFRQIPVQREGTLLDVGCGSGRFCHAAQAAGWQVFGVDVSQSAITIAQKTATFSLRCLTLEQVAEKEERYDVLTAFEVLEHLQDPVSFLKLAGNVLKPGGHIFCTVPNWECQDVQHATQTDWLPPIHVNFFTDVALRRLGATAGYSTVTTDTIWSDPYPSGWRFRLKWLKRRLLRRRQLPQGLWLHIHLPTAGEGGG